MARVDDYKTARKMAINELSGRSFAELVRASGFEAISRDLLRIPFLDRVYRVDCPRFSFVDESGADREVPLQEQVLILHYMKSSAAVDPSERWVAYREITGASFYFSAFTKRAIDPLKNVFGRDVEALVASAGRLNGKAVEPGDAAFEFLPFPRVPLRLTVWAGDDEFPPEANIIFDETIALFLSPEDIAWLAGMLVYRLMSISASASA